MSYDIFKSLHIIFVVSWFAGLFYIVRLFIYHTEAQAKSKDEAKILSDQFEIMEHKLWWIITTPAMILTVVFGVLMLMYNKGLLYQGWMHIKLTFVCLLLIYHFVCQKILINLKNKKFKWSSLTFRIWNEIATLFLVAIVFLVVMRNNLSWITGTVGFFTVGIFLMLAIKLYQRLRKS